MNDIQKALEIRYLNLQDEFDVLEKAKALPIGTIKKRSNGNFIKTAQGWKYHSKVGSEVGAQKEGANDIPSIGVSVEVKDDISLASFEGIKGKRLEVIGYKNGTLTVPKFLEVRDDKGKTYSINPNYVDEVKSKIAPSITNLQSSLSKLTSGTDLALKVHKDKHNPNFLAVSIKYPTGVGHLTVGGQRTSSGQQRDRGAAKAMEIGNIIKNRLQSKFNLDDVDVTDGENGIVTVFSVSDDFVQIK